MSNDGFIPEDQYQKQKLQQQYPDGFVPENQYKPQAQAAGMSQSTQPTQSGNNPLSGALNLLGLSHAGSYLGNLAQDAGDTGHQLYDIFKGATGNQQEKLAAGSDFQKRQGSQNTRNADVNPLNAGKSALEIASLASGPGKGKIGTLAAGGISGLEQGLAQDNATPGSVATSTGLGMGMSTLTKLIPGLGKILGKEATGVGEGLPLRGLRVNGTQLGKFEKLTGQELKDFMLKHNISGDFVTKADEMVNNLGEQYNNIAANSGRTLSKEMLTNTFEPFIKKFKGATTPEFKAAGEKLAGLRDSILGGTEGEHIPVSKLVDVKREIQSLISDSQRMGNTTGVQTYIQAEQALLESLGHATAGVTDNGQSINDVGKALQAAKMFQEIAQKQGKLGQGTNQIGLIPGVMSNTGAIIGQATGQPLLGPLAGWLAAKAAQDPRTIALESKGFKLAGKGITKASNLPVPDPITKLMQQLGLVQANQAVNNTQP